MKTTVDMFKLYRRAAMCVFVFCGLSAMGGLPLGMMLNHGGYLALSSLMAGISLTGILAWRQSYYENRTPIAHLIAFNFAMISGMALYCNLAFVLWAVGFEMDLGTVRTGRMGDQYWFGPALVFYAVICHAAIPKTERTGA